MAGGGNIETYIGSYTSDANATAFFTSRGYTQARGYLYYDSTLGVMKMWDGSAWVEVGEGGGGASPWTQAGGVIYPTTGTDDVAVGAAGVSGRWFDNGNMVLNGTVMAGGEVLRVVGSARVEDQIGVGGDVAADATCRVVDGLGNGATRGYRSELVYTDVGKTSFYGYESSISQGGSGAITQVRGFSSTVAVTASSIGELYGLRTGGSVGSSGSVGTSYGVYCGGLTGLGSALTTASYGVYVAQQGASATPNAYGIYVAPQSGASTYGIYQAGSTDLNYFAGNVGIGVEPSASNVVFARETAVAGSIFRAYFDSSNSAGNVQGFEANIDVNSGHTISTFTGFRVGEPTGDGSIDNAIGLHIMDLSANSTTSYAIYQAGSTDLNVFMGQVAVNQTVFSGANYVEVLDDNEDTTRYAFRAKLEKGAAGTKSLYSGLWSSAQVDAGTVTAIRHVQTTTTTAGGYIISCIGYHADMVVGSGDVVEAYYGLRIADSSGAGTITTVYGIDVGKGSTSSLSTTAYGVRVRGQAGTTTYGLYLDDQLGATSYGIYQAGSTDLNYFAGETGVGASADSGVSQLYVQRNESGTVGAIKAGIHTQLNYNGGGTNITEFRGVDVDIANKSTTASEDITKAIAFYANAPTSSGGEIGTAYGLFVEDLLNDSDVQAAWGVYQVGSSLRNYFSGVIGAKRTVPSSDYAIDAGDDININGTEDVIGYYVNGNKVVTSQQGAIANVGVDVHEAEDYICRQKVNAILAMLRVHGLIA